LKEITEYSLWSEIQRVAVAWVCILMEKAVGKLLFGSLNRHMRMDGWKVP
jgi:hypothetical protein